MNELLGFWAQWLRPSAGLPTVQWSLLLAVAAIAGHLLQRHTGLPKVVGYSIVGTLAGCVLAIRQGRIELCREAGDIRDRPKVAPGWSGLWDHRFLLIVMRK